MQPLELMGLIRTFELIADILVRHNELGVSRTVDFSNTKRDQVMYHMLPMQSDDCDCIVFEVGHRCTCEFI